MGNFMKKVWTESHGVIRSPSSDSRLARLSNPTDRLIRVSATLTLAAMTAPVRELVTL